MTLSERIAARNVRCLLCGEPDPVHSNACSSVHLVRPRNVTPEWRRRMEERLAKNGRVAEKALDR